MRLIDADNINFHCNYDGDCTGDIDDCKECENYICDFRDIQEQPTAYSVDKVVEELEDLEIHFDNDYFSSNREVMIVKNDAIEIVKQEAEQFGTDTNVGSNGWISCSSGVMPRANGWYLVTNHLGVVQEQRWSANHWEKLRDDAVLAWRE